MAQPFKHPTTGIYYIRRKVPPDLREVLGREYKRSLNTSDNGLAKKPARSSLDRFRRVLRTGKVSSGWDRAT
jgi:hypothetical protein